MVSPSCLPFRTAPPACLAVLPVRSYVKRAASAQGCDRHLLGLRMLMTPEEKAGCELVQDPAFAASCHWNVSTSQLVSEHVDGWGWGEVVPDGVGIAYDIKARSLHFCVTRWTSSSRPSTPLP